LPEHGGEHEADSRSRSESEEPVPEGSWATSGIESQRMTRSFDEEEVDTATQTFEANARDPAESGVEDDELPAGELGSPEKEADPE
jgi:hypothetical protein